MTLGVLLTHVAARWAVTRTPACGWVPDESEIEMTETINERVARILNNAGWTCSRGAHEPGSYDGCDECWETCTDVADVVIRARAELTSALTAEGAAA